MRAQLTTLDSRLLSFSADEADISWHMFGGPMLFSLPTAFSESDIETMRYGTLEVDGRWGKCWGGLATGVSTSKLEAGGFNLGMSMMRSRGWPVCMNQTDGYQSETWSPTGKKPKRGWHREKVKGKGWVRQKDDAQNNTVQVDPTNDAVRFTYSANQNYWDGSYAGALIEMEAANDATITFNWSRPAGSHWRLWVYAGVPAPASTDGDRWAWTLLWTQAETGANSGSASVHSTVPGATAFLLRVQNVGSLAIPATDQIIKFTYVKVYGCGITSTTPANIVGLALNNCSPLVDTSGRVIDASEAALAPFDTDGTPLDLLNYLLTQTSGRFFWDPTRTLTGRLWRPTYSPADDSIAYDIFAPESDLSGVDVDSSATHANVKYSAIDGGSLELQRSTTAGYLGRFGVEKWIEVDATQTTDPIQAAALGDLALAEAAYDRHAGSVQVEVVRDTNGCEVPLEHLEYGRRVRLRTAGKTITPRLTEGALSGGVLTATLDDSPYSLAIALAHLARK